MHQHSPSQLHILCSNMDRLSKNGVQVPSENRGSQWFELTTLYILSAINTAASNWPTHTTSVRTFTCVWADRTWSKMKDSPTPYNAAVYGENRRKRENQQFWYEKWNTYIRLDRTFVQGDNSTWISGWTLHVSHMKAASWDDLGCCDWSCFNSVPDVWNYPAISW